MKDEKIPLSLIDFYRSVVPFERNALDMNL